MTHDERGEPVAGPSDDIAAVWLGRHGAMPDTVILREPPTMAEGSWRALLVSEDQEVALQLEGYETPEAMYLALGALPALVQIDMGTLASFREPAQ